ncbi:MAG: hypothetical protein ABI831_04215 [Betaproteobacteria bacterium]
MARLLALWWIPIAAAFAAVLAWETDWGQGLLRPLVIPAAPASRAVPLTLLPEYKAIAGPDAYAEVVDRPLFSPTRRQAPPPPPPEQPKATMQTGLFQLTGTIQVGDKLYAFLKDTKSGKGLRAAQGDVLPSGAKLAKVDPDRVLLTQYDGEEEVKMQVAKSTRATPVPPGPAPPGTPQPSLPAQSPVSRAFTGRPGTGADPASGGPAGAPIVPGSTTLMPFVPGVATAPRPDGSSEVPPRRRGAMQ